MSKNRKLALDTNAVIALFAQDPSLVELSRASDVLYLPFAVVAELSFGALKSRAQRTNIARISQFAQDHTIAYPDAATLEIYGELRHQLEQQGRPIPVNDLWISCCCLQLGLTLVSRDAHFANIPRLHTITW